jgi:hypothetical protein
LPTPAATPSAGSGSTPSLTRLIRRRASDLAGRDRMPSAEDVMRALFDAVEDVKRAEENIRLARKEPKAEPEDATLYVSPSTREGSTMADVSRHFGGPLHNLLAEVAARLTKRPVEKSVGVWPDGAEESLVVQAHPKAARHVAAVLGLKANQKSVAVFHPDKAGQGVRYKFSYPSQPVDRVIQKFQEGGLPYGTHLFVDHFTSVNRSHVVSPERADGAALAVAAALGGSYTVEPGRVEFLGHDTDRAEGTKIFRNVLKGVTKQAPNPRS